MVPDQQSPIDLLAGGGPTPPRRTNSIHHHNRNHGQNHIPDSSAPLAYVNGHEADHLHTTNIGVDILFIRTVMLQSTLHNLSCIHQSGLSLRLGLGYTPAPRMWQTRDMDSRRCSRRDRCTWFRHHLPVHSCLRLQTRYMLLLARITLIPYLDPQPYIQLRI